MINQLDISNSFPNFYVFRSANENIRVTNKGIFDFYILILLDVFSFSGNLFRSKKAVPQVDNIKKLKLFILSDTQKTVPISSKV